MTPAKIIQEAQSEGVILTLSPSGTLKAIGDDKAVRRWLGVIREHKGQLIDALQVGAGGTALAAQDEQAIRAWLAFVDETDAAIIADVLSKCQRDPDALRYFLLRSKEVAK